MRSEDWTAVSEMGRSIVAVWTACLISGLAPAIARAQTAASTSEQQGRRLFTGEARLKNGGPACISCHNIAGLEFPGGGTLGPDLTGAYRKLGPNGTQSALQTLYFKVMTPIYTAHPLMPDEQLNLTAFFERASSQQTPPAATGLLLLAAILLGAVFVGLTGLVWRDRIRSVRGAMVARAMRQQGVKRS